MLAASRCARYTHRHVSRTPSWIAPRRCLASKADAKLAAAAKVADADADTPTPAKDKSNPDVLPFLQRPLGVREPPRVHTKTWAEKTDELMNQDKRIEERRHIIQQVGTGYWHDLNATRRHGGKTWIAPQVLIREDKALYFPDIAGTQLDSGDTVHTATLCKGKISVVAMLNTRISELHTATMARPTLDTFLAHPRFQYVQINLQENMLKGMLVSLFRASIRRAVPPALHPTYLVSSQSMEYIRGPLGLDNKHIGYVYLLDENMRIRWAACGDAKTEEIEALVGCARALLTRLDREKKGDRRQSDAAGPSGDAASKPP